MYPTSLVIKADPYLNCPPVTRWIKPLWIDQSTRPSNLPRDRLVESLECSGDREG